MSGRSTVANLFQLTNYINQAFAENKQIDVIYADLSKAYDGVNHNILIQKLKSIGLDGNIFNWFKSYFSKRVNLVKSNGTLFKCNFIMSSR